MTPILTVENLIKTYPAFRLGPISFQVEAGSIMGFIGRNGAGKTTTLKSILNIAHPDSGRIRYFGQELSGNERAIKQRVGFAGGAVNYYPRKKIADIIAVTRKFYGNKELRLSAHLLSYLFLVFSLMALIPRYPILLGAFFICFGLFQTFQNGRETNDVLYSALLPIGKKDVVKARYLFVCLIQITAFLLMAGLTALRMVFFASAAPYVNNAMMNSNPVFLAWTLLIFALFNTLFVGLFYKTAYQFGKPFTSANSRNRRYTCRRG